MDPKNIQDAQQRNPLATIFPVAKPIVGMVHCQPLPGSPRYAGQPMAEIVEIAVEDAQRCATGGMDGVMIENHGDIPFSHPDDIGMETVAAMTAIGVAIRQTIKLPIGLNVLANGVRQSIAVAKAIDAQFVRANQWANAYVANEGFVQAAAPSALRYRRLLGANDILVFADVHVKHGSHAITSDRSLAEQTQDVEFFDADVLIATGQRTSDPTPIEELKGVKASASLPVLIGSGLTASNADALLGVADGAIVGSWVKEGGLWWNSVSKERVRQLMDCVFAIRTALEE